MKIKLILLISVLLLALIPVSGFAQMHVTISEGPSTSICLGMQPQFHAVPTGGHAPYHYQWSPAQWLNSDTIANPTCMPPFSLNSDTSVVYKVKVTDSLGATDSASIWLQYYAISAFYITSTAQNNTICSGMSTVLTILSDHAYSYTWSNPSSLSSYNGNPVIATPIITTAYCVTATNNGCTATSSIYIQVNSCPYNILQGKVYSDLNANGTREAGEYLLPHVMVNVAPAASVMSYIYDSTYTAYVGTGSYTVTPDYVPYYTQTSNPNVTMGPFTTVVNRDVGIQALPGISDLKVDITSINYAYHCDMAYDVEWVWFWPFPYGSAGTFSVQYFNAGTVPLDGQIKVQYDTLVDNVGVFNPSLNGDTVFSIVGDTLVWAYHNLMPGEQRCFNFSVQDTNVVFGQMHTLSIIGYPLLSDTVPENNYDTCFQVVTASWDPNFKEVSPNTDLNIAQLAEGLPLTYTIHFQNTGTAAAHLVRLRDTLSQNLDMSSFEMISASHPYTLSMLGGNVVEWRFDPIVLPDSGTSQLLSNGFVKYRILPVATLLEDDSITNRASIYFDSNPAVVTNTVVSHMTLITVGHEPNHAIADPRIYPNPNNGAFSMDVPRSVTRVVLTNSYGQVLKSIVTNGESKLNFEINKSGMYYLQIIIEEKVITRKVIVIGR